MKSSYLIGFLGLILTTIFTPVLSAYAAPCLTTPTDPPGGVLGATVQTFIDLGINPSVTCIENSLWSDPSGFTLGSYVKGGDGRGGTIDPTGFNFNLDDLGSFALHANSRDFYWVQDSGNAIDFGGGVTGGRPSEGIVWDLGAPSNGAAVFVQVDHGPIPDEVLENTAWLSNDPNAADGGWTQAFLDHVYLQGWSADPNIADGFVAVYRLPSSQTFQYVSVTHGGPGAVLRDGDNEIDAVSGSIDVVVGGEIIPLDTTSLLLAGAQTGVLWMIPTLAGMTGVVIYLTKFRNKEN
ncbi:MAG: hypothetical protein ACRD94_03935 [Nitrosopumilaceae archaeon]